MADRVFITLAKAGTLANRSPKEISYLTYIGTLEMRRIDNVFVVPLDQVMALTSVEIDAGSGIQEPVDAYVSDDDAADDVGDEADRKVRSRSVLAVVTDPPTGVIALTDYLYVLIREHNPPKRTPKAADDARFKASLLSFAYAIATIALMRIPPHNGVGVAFGEAKYIGSDISVTALRTIRNALKELGLIVYRGGFNDPFDATKSFTTGIRHTGEFADLLRSYGVTPEDVFTSPVEVIAIRDATDLSVKMPEDVAASAAVLCRYNAVVQGSKLTLPDASWMELQRRVIKADGTGKTHKLHRGYDEHRIYLTRRFAETWDRGGRLYDAHYQVMPKDIRGELLIDGEPTVELDYHRLHPRMLFNQEGLDLDRDPYEVPGFDVPLEAAKETFNRLLNSRKKISFRPKDREYFTRKGTFNSYRDAMISHLKPISHRFQSDGGAQLQKLDSRIALNVIERCMDEDIAVYPVHDSFIVKYCNKQRLKIIMHEEYFKLMGFGCVVK